jgi:hypothetical protein
MICLRNRFDGMSKGYTPFSVTNPVYTAYVMLVLFKLQCTEMYFRFGLTRQLRITQEISLRRHISRAIATCDMAS